MWCNQFKFLVFGNIKRVFRRFALFKLIFFFYKIKKDFNKNQYFMCQILTSECWTTHSPASIWTEGRFDMWVTPKQTGLVFAYLNIKTFSCTGWSVSVLSRLHSHKYKCTFCWMKHHWTWLLSDIVAWDSF